LANLHACLLVLVVSIHHLEIQPKKSNEKRRKEALVMLTARYANRRFSQAAVMSRESDQSLDSPYRSGRKYEASELITTQHRASGPSLVLAHHR